MPLPIAVCNTFEYITTKPWSHHIPFKIMCNSDTALNLIPIAIQLDVEQNLSLTQTIFALNRTSNKIKISLIDKASLSRMCGMPVPLGMVYIFLLSALG